MGKEKRKMHLGGWQCLLWVFSPFVKLPEHWHCCPHWALVPKGSSRASPSSYDSRAAVHVPLSCSLPKLLSCTVSSSPSATTHSKSCRNAPARAPLCILALCPLCFHFLNPLAACLRGGSGYHGGPQTQPARASAGLELSSLAPARRSRCEAAPPARAAGHPRFPTGDLHQHIPAPRQTGRWLCLGSTGVFPGQIKSVCFFFFSTQRTKKSSKSKTSFRLLYSSSGIRFWPLLRDRISLFCPRMTFPKFPKFIFQVKGIPSPSLLPPSHLLLN